MPEGLALAIRDLKVVSPRGRLLLDLPALDAAPGTCIGISGPSGAGKSTLLYALAGLQECTTGSIRWGVTDLNTLRRGGRAAFRAAHMGFVFQDFMLFEELSAPGNAAIAAAFAPPARRSALLQRAGAGLVRFGIGEDGRAVDSFSGGERQRVAIARALAHDPAVLLADEPTASLHRQAAEMILTDLMDLTREGGRTLIAVSHDQALLDRMDRVIRLENGRLAEAAAA